MLPLVALPGEEGVFPRLLLLYRRDDEELEVAATEKVSSRMIESSGE